MDDERLNAQPSSGGVDDERPMPSDGHPVTSPADEQEPQPEFLLERDPEPERHRSLWALLLVILIIVLFVIVLLLLRQCGNVRTAGVGEEAGKQIEAVDVMEPVPGTISVWIAETTNIDRVLLGAGVSPRSITDLERGRFVVEVEPAQAEWAVGRIAQQKGVHDAGLVYEPKPEP